LPPQEERAAAREACACSRDAGQGLLRASGAMPPRLNSVSAEDATARRFTESVPQSCPPATPATRALYAYMAKNGVEVAAYRLPPEGEAPPPTAPEAPPPREAEWQEPATNAPRSRSGDAIPAADRCSGEPTGIGRLQAAAAFTAEGSIVPRQAGTTQKNAASTREE